MAANAAGRVATAALGGAANTYWSKQYSKKRPVSELTQDSLRAWSTQDSLQYMSQDEINRYYKRQRTMVRRPKGTGVVASLRSGRRRPLINFRMKDVMDMIAPTVHFKTQRNMTHISSTSPDQGIGYDYILTVDDVKNMMVKCADVNPLYNAGALDSSDDFTFVFNGGNYKYKISNSCNIDCYVDILVVTGKRPNNWSIDDAWSQDMIHDNTLTDTSGVYTQTSEERRLDLGNRPGKSGVKFNSNWRKRYVGRRVLKPGEEFTYHHKLMPWKWNVKTWNEHLTSSGASAADLPDYFEKTQAIMFIVHGQNVHDQTDGDCAPGSAQININVSETFSWRAVPGTKKDQFISQNALPTIAAGDQRIFQDDGDMQTGTSNL
jgi:hypothetical protein